MKRRSRKDGSVLMMALLTITILTLICATSLYVLTQNANATTQATSWEQSLSGAEAAVDQAMRALNAQMAITSGVTPTPTPGAWQGWYKVSSATSLPTGQPSGGSAASSLPGASEYNYYTSTISLQGEAGNSIRTWVTIDNGSVPPTSSTLTTGNGQGYRIRAAAAVDAPGPRRVSNNALDNDLRKISLRFDRLNGGNASAAQAVRRIEVVAVPVGKATSPWQAAFLAKYEIKMSGGSYIDSFDSSDSTKSTNHQYDQAKRQSHGNIATTNTNGATDLKGMYVYGTFSYSGGAPANAQHVTGGVYTPFTATINDPSLPSGWSPDQTITTGSQNPPPFTSLTVPGGSNANHPYRVKVIGNFNVPAGQTVTYVAGSNGDLYLEIYVTPGSGGVGKFRTSGSGYINLPSNIHVKYYVDGDISVDGGSFNNLAGYAQNNQLIGLGASGTVTASGSGTFIGTVYAPNYNVVVSGGANYSGAFVGKTLNLSGGASIHYDEALKNYTGDGGSSTGNYAYASWFEDNSMGRLDKNGKPYMTY